MVSGSTAFELRSSVCYIDAMHRMSLIAVLLLVGACRNYTTLDELERPVSDPHERAAEGQPETDALEANFNRVRRIFVADGAAPLLAEESVTVGEEGHDFVIELREGSCYTFIGHGAGPNHDIDLRLDNPDGQPVASDRSPDPFPVIAAWCAPVSGPYRLHASSVRGEGEALFGAYALPVESAEAAARLEVLRETHLGAGEDWGPVLDAYIGPGEVASASLALLPGDCYGVVAVGEATITDLDVVVLDDHGEVITRDIATTSTPAVRVCSDDGGTARAEFRPYAGSGTVWWRVYRLTEE